jgi:hypothetical protein
VFDSRQARHKINEIASELQVLPYLLVAPGLCSADGSLRYSEKKGGKGKKKDND